MKDLAKRNPYSRSKEHEGRRLIETDGGWLIVNYGKYRQRRDPEKRREQNRKAQERFRDKPKVSQSKPKSAQAEAEAEAEKTKRERAPSKFLKPTIQEVTDYAESIGYDSLNSQQFIDLKNGNWLIVKDDCWLDDILPNYESINKWVEELINPVSE